MGLESGKDVEYKIYTLGDVGVIELLISYRYKYDENLFIDSNDSIMDVSGALRLNEEVVLTYATLDDYIKKCKFSEQQMEVLRLVGEGYLHNEIARELNVQASTIAGKLRTIYRRIAKENEWQWRKCVYVNKLGLRTKQCSKCKEELPGTVEFYRDHTITKDGFQSQCRQCEK